MSSVLAEFLQQFFTFIFLSIFVVVLGGKPAWFLLLFIPYCAGVGAKDREAGSTDDSFGQDKLAEIQNILHETITGNRIVKAFGMERWEAVRFRGAAHRLFRLTCARCAPRRSVAR